MNQHPSAAPDRVTPEEGRVLQILTGARLGLLLAGVLVIRAGELPPNSPDSFASTLVVAASVLPPGILGFSADPAEDTALVEAPHPPHPDVAPLPVRHPELERLLAKELRSMGTLHPDAFVDAIAAAAAEDPDGPPLTVLLALAKTETWGDVLDVSEAGAAGLPQATPVALLASGYEGPLFLTEDYAIGTRAYFLKKPLDDADTIVSRLLARKRTAQSWAEARRLLDAAKELRTIGIDELLTLTPHVDVGFEDSVLALDEHNERVLDRLERLLDRQAGPSELVAFRDEVRAEYRVLRGQQRTHWKRYQDDLIAARNRRIATLTSKDPMWVKKHDPYTISEELAELDGRFSIRTMATFLREHYRQKEAEVRALPGVREDEVAALTWRNYNGGLVNLARMRAGLITTLKENDNYVERVGRFQARLERAVR